MKNLLTQALKILGDTGVDDAGTRARGRRAHARVLAMITLADETARLSREQRIANLLALARVDPDAGWALEAARRMLTQDRPGASGTTAD